MALLVEGMAHVGVATADAPAICGQVLTQSVKLTKKVVCPGDGPTIGADNIILDLNGHKLSGNHAKDGATIGVQTAGHSGVTVTNGTIEGFGVGIFVHQGRRNTLSDLTVTRNIGPFRGDWGDGIVMLNSSANTVIRDNINQNGVYDGVGVFGPDSHGNVITHSTIEQNNLDMGEVGVDLGLAVFPGESVLEGGDHTTVSNNVIRDSPMAGVYMCGQVIDCVTRYNTIANNVIDQTTHPYPCGFPLGVGISVSTRYPQQVPKPFPTGYYTGGHVIIGNTIAWNWSYGIETNHGSAHGIKIYNNAVYGNLPCRLPNTYDIQGDCDPAFAQDWKGNSYMGAPGLTMFDASEFLAPPPGGCTRFIEQNHHLAAPLTPPPYDFPLDPDPPRAQAATTQAPQSASAQALPGPGPDGMLIGPVNPLGPDSATVVRNITRSSTTP